eukprot:jgi/Astpho2/5781/fgenesh1_pg.00080_%23_42_t
MERVETFAAKHKLAGEQGLAGKKNYWARKKASVLKASQLVCVQEPEWKKYFDVLKKKDDAADALNQCIAYVDHLKNPPAVKRKGISARKPKAGVKVYTASNIKHGLKQMMYPAKRSKKPALHGEALQSAVDDIPAMKKGVQEHFGTLDAAIDALFTPASDEIMNRQDDEDVLMEDVDLQ